MSQTATKDDLKILGDGLRGEIKTLGNTFRDEIQENTRDIISHFNKSQSQQTAWIRQEFVEVNTKLEAVMSGEVLATRKQNERIVHALKNKGISLDEEEIFRA